MWLLIHAGIKVKPCYQRGPKKVVFVNNFSIVFQLEFGGNFILLSAKWQWSDRYEMLHMARPLCRNDVVTNNGFVLKHIFYRIWILMVESFMKLTPGLRHSVRAVLSGIGISIKM